MIHLYSLNKNTYLLGDDDFSINSRLKLNVGDLLHDLLRGVQVKNTLVDSHLPPIESVGTLTARRLPHAQAQDLGWHADRSGDLELLAQSLVLELRADLLQGLNVLGCKGNSDTVDLGVGDLRGLEIGKGIQGRI